MTQHSDSTHRRTQRATRHSGRQHSEGENREPARSGTGTQRGRELGRSAESARGGGAPGESRSRSELSLLTQSVGLGFACDGASFPAPSSASPPLVVRMMSLPDSALGHEVAGRVTRPPLSLSPLPLRPLAPLTPLTRSRSEGVMIMVAKQSQLAHECNTAASQQQDDKRAAMASDSRGPQPRGSVTAVHIPRLQLSGILDGCCDAAVIPAVIEEDQEPVFMPAPMLPAPVMAVVSRPAHVRHPSRGIVTRVYDTPRGHALDSHTAAAVAALPAGSSPVRSPSLPSIGIAAAAAPTSTSFAIAAAADSASSSPLQVAARFHRGDRVRRALSVSSSPALRSMSVMYSPLIKMRSYSLIDGPSPWACSSSSSSPASSSTPQPLDLQLSSGGAASSPSSPVIHSPPSRSMSPSVYSNSSMHSSIATTVPPSPSPLQRCALPAAARPGPGPSRRINGCGGANLSPLDPRSPRASTPSSLRRLPSTATASPTQAPAPQLLQASLEMPMPLPLQLDHHP